MRSQNGLAIAAALAPTGTELPALLTQGAVLMLVGWLGWRTVRRP